MVTLQEVLEKKESPTNYYAKQNYVNANCGEGGFPTRNKKTRRNENDRQY